jgi:hypothetical protein
MSEAQEQEGFTAPLYCMKCSRAGFAIWERNIPSPWRPVMPTSPVSTSDGFYLRAANVYMYSNPQIVCGKCGTVHRDTVS